MDKKKIGILGSGGVAQTLATGFMKHGYEVKMGTRDNLKLAEFQSKAEGKLSIGSFAEAAAFGDILVLAVKGNVALDVLKLADGDNLKGKVIIDPTNPIEDKPPENGVLRFFSTINRSLMEDLQAAYPQAHFVKAFSMIGGPHMVNPQFALTPTMFICGNDKLAKQLVAEILITFGFEPEDMGADTAARAIEPLCILWCIPGLTGGGWNHALKLLKKDERY
jgi:8-hydroxy-5-deazaflavin:NADPH oxidoreductase